MTEQKWLRCVDPHDLLVWGMSPHATDRGREKRLPGTDSPRKLRLLACGCCRFCWHLLTDKRSRRVVEVAEAYADGQVNAEELAAAKSAADQVSDGLRKRFRSAVRGLHGNSTAPVDKHHVALCAAQAAVCAAATRGLWGAVCHGVDRVASAFGLLALRLGERRPVTERQLEVKAIRKTLADLLRDVFGNPFRPATVAPPWLSWNGAAVPKVARAIYEEHTFDRLPVLADALEEAGCGDADILGHLRGPGPHARGCWVLDLVLGKA
jgi:hypothetical protein